MQLNYTTMLNVLFLVLAAVLTPWFFRTGGLQMLRMMDEPMDAEPAHTSDVLGEVEATYTCPMHPDVHQTSAGMCPECGMALRPV